MADDKMTPLDIDALIKRLGVYNHEDYIGNVLQYNIVVSWLSEHGFVKMKSIQESPISDAWAKSDAASAFGG